MFAGIGCLERAYNIELHQTLKTVIVPPRPNPYRLKNRVKTAWGEICSLGNIVPVDQPTDCINAVVVVYKKCTDNLRFV